VDWIPIEGRNRDAEAGGTKVWDGDASEGAKFDVQRGGERQPEAERCIMADHVSLCRTVENEEGLGERIGGEDAGIRVTRHGATEKIAAARAGEGATNGITRLGEEAQLCEVGRGVEAEVHMRAHPFDGQLHLAEGEQWGLSTWDHVPYRRKSESAAARRESKRGRHNGDERDGCEPGRNHLHCFPRTHHLDHLERGLRHDAGAFVGRSENHQERAVAD
jgi:hypothetical protein